MRINRIVICIILLVGFHYSKAQTGYQIIFEQTVETNDEQVRASLENIGEMVTVWYIQERLFRSESHMELTGTTTIIHNGLQEKTVALLEGPSGQKHYLTKDLNQDQSQDLTVTKTEEKKTIAGFECVRYEVIDQYKRKTSLYVTEAIENPYDVLYGDKVPGLVLCTITHLGLGDNETKIILRATKVLEKELPEELFSIDIPEGFTPMETDTNHK